MILALIGKDQFSKDKQVDKFLTDALGDRKNDPLSKQVVYATDTNIPSVAGLIMESCGAVSMFAPEQAVVVRNADAMKAEESKALARWLKDAPDCKLLLDACALSTDVEGYIRYACEVVARTEHDFELSLLVDIRQHGNVAQRLLVALVCKEIKRTA